MALTTTELTTAEFSPSNPEAPQGALFNSDGLQSIGGAVLEYSIKFDQWAQNGIVDTAKQIGDSDYKELIYSLPEGEFIRKYFKHFNGVSAGVVMPDFSDWMRVELVKYALVVHDAQAESGTDPFRMLSDRFFKQNALVCKEPLVALAGMMIEAHFNSADKSTTSQEVPEDANVLEINGRVYLVGEGEGIGTNDSVLCLQRRTGEGRLYRFDLQSARGLAAREVNEAALWHGLHYDVIRQNRAYAVKVLESSVWWPDMTEEKRAEYAKTHTIAPNRYTLPPFASLAQRLPDGVTPVKESGSVQRAKPVPSR